MWGATDQAMSDYTLKTTDCSDRTREKTAVGGRKFGNASFAGGKGKRALIEDLKVLEHPRLTWRAGNRPSPQRVEGFGAVESTKRCVVATSRTSATSFGVARRIRVAWTAGHQPASSAISGKKAFSDHKPGFCALADHDRTMTRPAFERR